MGGRRNGDAAGCNRERDYMYKNNARWRVVIGKERRRMNGGVRSSWKEHTPRRHVTGRWRIVSPEDTSNDLNLKGRKFSKLEDFNGYILNLAPMRRLPIAGLM